MKLERVIDLVDEWGIERILDSLNIEYQRNGDWIRIKCLFHNGDKFNLTYKNKFFYCFSECNCSYNIINIVSKKLNLSFFESIRWICVKIGVAFNSEQRNPNPKAEELLKTLKKANRLKLSKNKEQTKEIDFKIFDNIKTINHKILKDEGFDEDIVNYFNLGVAFDGYFDKRVTIPIDDINGRIISMSGRLPDKYVDESNPKYKHLDGSQKSKTLYNISRAYKSIEEKGYVIVVEGFKSVWRLHQWGFDNSVAVMGASLSEEQKILLLKLGSKIFICGDNDEAGKRLNQQVYNKCSKFANVIKLDISNVIDENKSSIDEIYKNQFKLLIKGE